MMAERRARTVERGAAALTALLPAVRRLVGEGGVVAAAKAGSERRFFRPEEDDLLRAWLARLLTVRHAVWEVVDDAERALGGIPGDLAGADELRCFAVGYAAACLAVHLDRHLVEDVATSSPVQRKLNEGVPEHRIPRKSYTTIFEAFTDLGQALRLLAAMRLRRDHRRELAALAGDPDVGPVVAELEWLESALDPSPRRYAALVTAFGAHAVRRAIASGSQQALFTLLEGGGRLVAEVRDRRTARRLDRAARQRLEPLLCPGDVLVTRTGRALSNLILPGYWPHAALYVGSRADCVGLGVGLPAHAAAQWGDEERTLEALKDGVRFRALDETLAVDAVAVLSPLLEPSEIATAIVRASCHAGKGYDFDFDFFRADCLVCTEVIFRAYDGIGGIRFELSERMGRPTLAATDILDAALARRGFAVKAAFGCPGAEDDVLVGEAACAAIAATLGTDGDVDSCATTG